MKILAWPAYANTTGNPYNRLLSDALEAQGVDVHEFTPERALKGRYDLWHMHWPDDVLSYPSTARAAGMMSAVLALMAWARIRGTRIVWTVHDLGPHDNYHPLLERIFWNGFIPQVDGFISLSATGREMARAQHPMLNETPSKVVPHGHYRAAYPDPIPRAEGREALGLESDMPVILYIGRIRPYKNVGRLIRAFKTMDRPKARLVVAGNPVDGSLRESLQYVAASDPRVRLDLRFIPPDLVPTYMAATDLVALPYDNVLHSGAALLALSFNRPVMVPARGAMRELQEYVGSQWVHTFDGRLLASKLSEGLNWAMHTPRDSEAPLDLFGWDVLAERTIDLYRQVLQTRG
ncbi:MAG: glycosyltransferase family 4 protein [Longimonas sp.]|uniref:glycosyltransferase family 4 protein n=1 Tax=Longimonas sp. TaxID=2039626 RepID=UPI00335E7556